MVSMVNIIKSKHTDLFRMYKHKHKHTKFHRKHVHCELIQTKQMNNQSKKSFHRMSFTQMCSSHVHSVFFLFLFLLHSSEAYYDSCLDNSTQTFTACHPDLWDITRGSQVQITLDPVDSTCGTPTPSTFKSLTDRSRTQQICDSNSAETRHPIQYLIDADLESWWQSINRPDSSSNELPINIKISFKKMHRLAGDIIITFNSARPRDMVLEKSIDFGQTWTPLQYYSANCNKYSGVPTSTDSITVQDPTTVICTNRYTEISSRPIKGSTVEFPAQEQRFDLFLGSSGFDFSTLYEALDGEFLKFLCLTDLRIRLVEPADARSSDNELYNYGISNIQVMGRCFCNLHATQCTLSDGDVSCACQHNTMGKDCESCLPLYNDRPWQIGSYTPYFYGTARECKKCECNNHANSCTYNSTYGRGTCNDCLHNTTGLHCELCDSTFYPNISTLVSDKERCLECNCEPLGVLNNAMECAQGPLNGQVVGQCPCKPLVMGRQCNSCAPGYFGLFLDPLPGTCKDCSCNLDGTSSQSNVCAQATGQCPCKASITGKLCGICKDGYYNFPTNSPQNECIPCRCDVGGSTTRACDKITGKCSCKEGISGDKCNRAETGHYVPFLDTLMFEPAVGGGCSTSSTLWTASNPFDGEGFLSCPLPSASTVTVSFSPISGGQLQKQISWPYHPVIRYTNPGTEVNATMTIAVTGSTPQTDLTPLSNLLGEVITPGCSLGTEDVSSVDLQLKTESSRAAISESETISLDSRCQYSIVLQLTRKDTESSTDETVMIDSVHFLPALSSLDGSLSFDVLTTAENKDEVKQSYLSCLQQVASLATRSSAITLAPCQTLLFSVSAELLFKASDCGCSEKGSENPTSCQSLGGQCSCRSGVTGQNCDICYSGYYNFSNTGCTPCNCFTQGSRNGACDKETGQCPCLPDVGQISNNLPDASPPVIFNGTCSQCLINYFGITSGQGCQPCNCNSQGSNTLQCEETGQCVCKDSVQGSKCDACKDTYFGFGTDGCSMCNCSQAGSLSLSCNQATGQCDCKVQANGQRCDACPTGHFNLAKYNPKGCQPCFCYGHGSICQSADGFKAQKLVASTTKEISLLTGERHTSYGQILTLNLTAAYILDISGERVISLEGDEKTVYHLSKNNTILSPSTPVVYDVRLLEGSWYLEDGDEDTDDKQPTALELLRILTDLRSIRVINSFKGQAVRAVPMYLEIAVPIDESVDQSVEAVQFVERCTCNAGSNVGGLSCQDCATGFRRENALLSTSYDTCIACNCNNRGSTSPPECDQLTGVCLNCRNGTSGGQCENCAAFVTGSECDVCQNNFWGLSQDGCKVCACVVPGSTSQDCNDDTGQCSCAANVRGRTCNQCEENFQNLQTSGCEACGSCYDLVQDQIKKLRDALTELNRNVSSIEANNASVSEVPFVTRFEGVQQDTQRLVLFLQSADQSQAQVETQIVQFEASLTTVAGRLDTLNDATVLSLEKSLTDIETSVKTAQIYRDDTEKIVKESFTKLENLVILVNNLRNLVASLDDVYKYLLNLASSSSANSQLIAVLDSLEKRAKTANDLANTVFERAQEALKIYQNTTEQILKLQQSVSSIIVKSSSGFNKAKDLSRGQETLQATVTRLQTELASLQQFTVPQDNRVQAADTFSQAIRAQISALSTQFLTTNNTVLATKDTVQDLVNQTNTETSSVEELTLRSTKADQSIRSTQDSVDKLFKSAENILDILTKFTEKKNDIVGRANTALAQVPNVIELVDKIQADADTLTTILQPLSTKATAALSKTQNALDIIRAKDQRLQPVATSASALKSRVESSDDNAGERKNILNNTRAGIIAPAQQQCTELENRYTKYEQSSADVNARNANATSKVSSAVQRARRILVQLNALNTVDTSTAAGLLKQAQEARAALDYDNLRAVISDLLTKRDTQKAEIESLKQKKDRFVKQVQNLRTLQQQIGLSSP